MFKPYKAFSKDCTFKIISPDIVSDVKDVISTKTSLVNRGIELLIKVSDFRLFSIAFDKNCRDTFTSLKLLYAKIRLCTKSGIKGTKSSPEQLAY